MKRLLTLSSKKAKSRPTVAIEFSREHLTVATIEPAREGSKRFVRWRRVAWRPAGPAVTPQQELTELTRVLKSLAAEEHWGHQQPVFVALSSDFCVTRVIAGENDAVTRELANLEERSSLYLMLGPGNKIWAKSHRAIDVKRRHAWMSVINESSMDLLTQAAHNAGLRVERVEHSLLSLCRAVGRMGKDQQNPVLILDVGQRGVDLGICYRGELLLDFRPGGGAAKEQIARTVVQHLKRLQRYCDRYFRFAQGQIRHIYICGDSAEVSTVYDQFARCEELTAELLEPGALFADCNLHGDDDGAEKLPVLGTALLQDLSPAARHTPDLLETVTRRNRGPLISEVLAAGWPIAASLLLAAGMWVVSSMEQARGERLENEGKALLAATDRIKQMQFGIVEANHQLVQAERLRGKLFNPPYNHLVEVLGRCLPEGVWLESVKVDRDGNAIICGPSQTENGIYEFVGYLQKARRLRQVALEQTQPVKLATGYVTKFEVRCKFNGRADAADKENLHDRNVSMAVR